MSDFGVNELNIRGSSGTPQVQSVDNLFLRVGTDKTVVIGDSDSDFNSPAPGAVDSSNTTVLNVGIVTANEYYGTFKGTIQTDDMSNLGQLDLINSSNVLTGGLPSNLPSAYHLALVNPANDTGEAVGLSFAITAGYNENVGAAIYHLSLIHI